MLPTFKLITINYECIDKTFKEDFVPNNQFARYVNKI